MKPRTKFRHYLEAVLIWALPYALRPLPYSLRIKAGGVIIGAALKIIPTLKRRITNNLDHIYPDMPAPEKSMLAKRISANVGERFIESFYNKTFYKQEAHFHYKNGAFDQIIAATKAGRPVIIVSGHFGQWEAIRVVLASMGHPSAAIYRKSANPIFQRHFKAAMSVGGAPLFAAGSKGTRQMLKHLKSGGIVSVLLDQRVSGGVPLDFLGKAALSSTIMAQLALKTNALILPVYAVMRPDRRDCDIIVEPPLEHSDPTRMTQEINDSLSAQVMRNPEQWYWLHKRWARASL